MFGSRLRGFAVPALTVGALAVTGLVAAPANASAAVSGTGTFTVSLAAQASLAQSWVIAVPASDESVSYDKAANTVSVAYTATGGNGSVSAGTGSVQYGDGGATVVNITNGKTVDLVDLTLNLATDQLVFTPEHGSPVAVLDLVGTRSSSVDGGGQTFSASTLAVDPAGAAYLNGALGSTAFNAGAQVGSFTTTFSS